MSRQPTPSHPNLVSLTSNARGFEQFDALPSPSGLTFDLVFGTRDSFAFYVEADTSVGRRQFKFQPGSLESELRFGYRYQVGLGPDARNGETQSFEIDLAETAETVEPGTIIRAVTAVFVRLAGDLVIDVLEDGIPPEPPQATPMTSPSQAGPSLAGLSRQHRSASTGRHSPDGWGCPMRN